MNIKKPITALLTSAMVFASSSGSIVAADNLIKTNHNTYIDPATLKEYDAITKKEMTKDHMDHCKYYNDFISSVHKELEPQPVEPEEEEKENEVPNESEEKTDETIDEAVDSEIKDDVEESVETEKEKVIDPAEDQKEEKKEIPYLADTWYHPSNINPQGYTGKIQKAIMKDSFVTCNWDQFKVKNNPFALGQCTYFAWSRFYQVYGFDSGARGNGKTNAAEIVKENGDKFVLSSTPSAGAVYSIEKNSKYPEYGHVGFIEAFDGEYIWISEGNVEIQGTEGNIWLHKAKWDEFKEAFPDVTFAVPKEMSTITKRILQMDVPQLELKVAKVQLKRLP